jgi:AcrR family transcriptional regulator
MAESTIFMQDGTKETNRPRGRPPEFDEETALGRATEVFWSRGLAATSLSDLAVAMDMNRPSIANAFGDKEALYRETLARFIDQLKAEVSAVLFEEHSLDRALMAFYRGALDVYFSSKPAPGCFVMCTAPVEAIEHPQVRADLKRLIGELDGALARRFEQAKQDGQFSTKRDSAAAAKMTQAVLHSLAIRARSGASKASLMRMASDAVAILVR